jgi:hypothetical protein
VKEPVARWDLPVKFTLHGMSVHSICSLLQFAAVIQKLTERFGVI